MPCLKQRRGLCSFLHLMLLTRAVLLSYDLSCLNVSLDCSTATTAISCLQRPFTPVYNVFLSFSFMPVYSRSVTVFVDSKNEKNIPIFALHIFFPSSVFTMYCILLTIFTEYLTDHPNQIICTALYYILMKLTLLP